MRLLPVFAVLAALAACAPQQAAPTGATATTRHHYEDPNIGSLLGGNPDTSAGNGYLDPSMNNHTNGGTSH